MPIRVQVGSRIVEFPDGTPEAEMLAALQTLPSEPVVSHESPRRPEEILAASDPDYLGRDPDLNRRVSANVRTATESAPIIGGGVGGFVGGIPGAMAGASGGALVRDLGRANRGDARTPQTPLDAAGSVIGEGAKQAALEAAGLGTAKVLGAGARAGYRAAIPKQIQDKFSQADLAARGLADRVLLGTRRGTASAGAARQTAGNQIHAAEASVPEMFAHDIQAAFRPKYNRALVAGKRDRAVEISDHVRKVMDELGTGPMSPAAQLARKELLEQEGKSAMTAANSNMAAVNPQLANVERKAILRNLRSSPEMASALNRSQAAIGVERAAKATENSSVLNRLRGGGVWNALQSPGGLSGTAIGVNELSRMPLAQLVRVFQMMQLDPQE